MDEIDVDEERKNRKLFVIIVLIACLVVVNIAIEATLLLR